MLRTYYLEGNSLHKWLVLGAVCLAVFTTTLNTTAVMNALLAMSNELHLTSISLQWIVNSYLLACASFIMVGGQLGDLFDRRNMFLTGASLFIVASLIIALAHEPTIIIIGHAGQGLSAFLITPMTLSIAKIAFSGSQEDLAVIFWTEIVG